jgi:outer membrane protein assembly factor BamE (lipoprotein component of BamABCDE complex)
MCDAIDILGKNLNTESEDIMRTICLYLLLVLIPIFFAGCIPATQHRQDVTNADADRISVGNVQREIRVGMSSAEVVEVLGSPNMVTTDEKRREVWIYDKIATDRAYSASSGGISALILGGNAGGSGALGGGIGSGFSKDSGASSISQRTLTVIIKFDEQSTVRDFAYRQSSF